MSDNCLSIAISFNDAPVRTVSADQPLTVLPLAFPANQGIGTVAFSIPILDIQGYWIPEALTPVMRLQWIVTSVSAGQKGIPFMAFFNTSFLNRCSFGLSNWQDDIEIIAKVNQERQCYDVTIRIALDGIHTAAKLTLDRRDIPWSQALATWRDSLEIAHCEYPDAAWQPVFCSWYAVHAAMTQQWTDANAAIAADMGFKTLIIDDGWCFDQPKRVTPETLVDWYENIGDWKVSPVKYPTFTAHCQTVQNLGMRYMLWVTPFLIGTKSKFHAQFSHALEGEYHEGHHRLNCLDDDAASTMMDQLVAVIRDNNLNGLKIDFLDIIQPDVDAPRGRRLTQFITELSRRIRDFKADALIEFRQSYATPGMAPLATQFRAGDVPFDFITNFQRLAQIRLTMGDGIPVHADPAYWNDNESDLNISRHLIASLLGVPMLSMELTTMPESTQSIVRHWLNFYQRHRGILNFGHWEMHYSIGGISFAQVADHEQSIILLLEPSAASLALAQHAGRKATLLNLSEESIPGLHCQPYDMRGNVLSGTTIPAGGYGVVAGQ